MLKVERVDGGDINRHQLRDIPKVDALYFTQLNSTKKSLALNLKTPDGKTVLKKLTNNPQPMEMKIVWRNPLPLTRTKRRLQRIRRDQFGAVYAVTTSEITQEFEVIADEIA